MTRSQLVYGEGASNNRRWIQQRNWDNFSSVLPIRGKAFSAFKCYTSQCKPSHFGRGSSHHFWTAPLTTWGCLKIQYRTIQWFSFAHLYNCQFGGIPMFSQKNKIARIVLSSFCPDFSWYPIKQDHRTQIPSVYLEQPLKDLAAPPQHSQVSGTFNLKPSRSCACSTIVVHMYIYIYMYIIVY